jgi:hypothetical protein
MRRTVFLLMAAMVALTFAGAAHGAIVNLTADDFVTVDSTTYELVTAKPTDPGPGLPAGAGLMWEWDAGKNDWKSCICQMVAFRALQAVGQYAGISDFTSAGTDILTGWNTDGPEDLYVHRMGWVEGTNFDYADPITGNAQLDLADAWYEYTISGTTYRVESQGGNYAFTDDTGHDGYQAGWDFFDYRTFVKEGGSGQTKTYFATVVRPQIVDNFKGATSFDVHPVPLPGALWLLGSGILGLAGLRKKCCS